jgi:hypothetical protein
MKWRAIFYLTGPTSAAEATCSASSAAAAVTARRVAARAASAVASAAVAAADPAAAAASEGEDAAPDLDVAAQVELKANFEGGSSYKSFNRLVPGTFNVGIDRVNLHRLTWTTHPRRRRERQTTQTLRVLSPASRLEQRRSVPCLRVRRRRATAQPPRRSAPPGSRVIESKHSYQDLMCLQDLPSK